MECLAFFTSSRVSDFGGLKLGCKHILLTEERISSARRCSVLSSGCFEALVAVFDGLRENVDIRFWQSYGEFHVSALDLFVFISQSGITLCCCDLSDFWDEVLEFASLGLNHGGCSMLLHNDGKCRILSLLKRRSLSNNTILRVFFQFHWLRSTVSSFVWG